MKKITVRSPTRVDLAGGTLDLWPLYNFVDSAKTVNVAIDIYTTVELEPRSDGSIELVSEDLGLSKKYKNLEECFRDTDQRLNLLQVQLKFWKPEMGFRLVTKSESPVGGGLGGSSSLTVSLLKAFDQFAHQNYSRFSSVEQLVQVAHNLEAQIINAPTGTQDYFPAACGGLNILDYDSTGIHQKVYPITGSDLEKHFLLIYTGKAHHSGLNNFEVLTKAVNKDPVTMKALFDIKRIAQETAEVCAKGQYQKLPELFRYEYDARVRLAPAFSSPEIEKLHEVSLQAGAQAVKICGAGGGGCVLVWVAPGRRQGVIEICEKNGFIVLPAKPVAPIN